MDDGEYERLCARPDVMRREEIRATVALLRERHNRLAARLSTLLLASPLPKPEGHSGGPGPTSSTFIWSRTTSKADRDGHHC
jgi:hypothetical protein